LFLTLSPPPPPPVAEDAENDWYHRLQTLQNELNRQSEWILSFSLSGIFDKPSDLPKAWHQVQFIHITPGIDAVTNVGQMKNIPGSSRRLAVSIEMPLMMYNAMYGGNGQAVYDIYRECVDSLPDTGDTALPDLVFNMLHDLLVLFRIENPAAMADVTIPEYIRSNRKDIFETQFPECFH
jgi:hypothetical protein